MDIEYHQRCARRYPIRKGFLELRDGGRIVGSLFDRVAGDVDFLTGYVRSGQRPAVGIQKTGQGLEEMSIFARQNLADTLPERRCRTLNCAIRSNDGFG